MINREAKIQVVFVGPTKVGKTSAFDAFHGKTFPKKYEATVGIDYWYICCHVANKIISIKDLIYQQVSGIPQETRNTNLWLLNIMQKMEL